MKTISLFQKIALITLVVIIFPFSNSLAHEVKTIGSMDVLLHMDPQDSPVIGEPATLYFAFTDQNQKFSFETCFCDVSILNNNQTLFKEKAITADPSFGRDIGIVNFTFSKKGVYTVLVNASSIDNSFSPFSVSYDIRVERENEDQLPIDPVVPKETQEIKTSTSKSISYDLYIYGLAIIGALAILIVGLKRK